MERIKEEKRHEERLRKEKEAVVERLEGENGELREEVERLRGEVERLRQ